MIGADELDDMDDRASDVRGLEAADRSLPMADPDHPTRGGDAANLVVAQVAPVVTGSANASVGRDHGTRRESEGLVERRRRHVGDIDDDAEALHLQEGMTA